MGAIWRAEHLVLAAPVAIKLIDPEIAGHEETLARFMREAQAAASLRSPHVVQILDYGVDDDTPFMVMELLEGETLAERLKRNGPLTRAETARFLTHVARAVGRAHDAGITHRDLKPENVFIVHNEDDEIAKVLDFGVAKVEKATLGPKGEKTRTGSLLGTPYYMSPEQAQGNKDVDFRSDLWAFGVIAFECLTGKRPFESEGLGDLVLQICVRDIPLPSELVALPEEFDAWFLHACARNPEERFGSAREMAEALREALGETRETVVTLNDEDRPPRPPLKSAAGAGAKADSGDDTKADPGDDAKAGSGDDAKADSRDDAKVAPRPSQAETRHDPSIAQATAETIQASPSFRPSALDAAAAEREHRERGRAAAAHPAEESSSRAGAILAVAGVALLLGLVGGFIVLGQRQHTDDRPLPQVNGAGGAAALAPSAEAGAHHFAHGVLAAGLHDAGPRIDASNAGAEAGVEAGASRDAGAHTADAGVFKAASDAGKRRRDAAAATHVKVTLPPSPASGAPQSPTTSGNPY